MTIVRLNSEDHDLNDLLRYLDGDHHMSVYDRQRVAQDIRAQMGTPRGEFLTTQEVARICRTAPETVRYWRHVGKGPAHFKLGRRVLYGADAVEAWIKAAQS
jgi:hypothetical protein